jgi:hypothetical protein
MRSQTHPLAHLAASWFAVILCVLAPAAEAQQPPTPLLFHASQSGRQTLDQGEGGGNPFASALIELLSARNLRLADLPPQLTALTLAKSHSFQQPDVPSHGLPRDWPLQPKAPEEKRVALVLVFSDYAQSGGASSLPGAKHDAARVGRAFADAGFNTRTVIDPDPAAFQDALRDFALQSAAADMAAVYVTGHGVEVDGAVYLLPGDYPVARRNEALQERAIPLVAVVRTARARGVNLIFYGGCRDNPFGTP